MPKMQHEAFSMKADERNICDQITNARGIIYLFIYSNSCSKQTGGSPDYDKLNSPKEVSKVYFPPLMFHWNGPLLPRSLPLVFQLTCNYYAS